MRKLAFPAAFTPATGVVDASNVPGFNPALTLAIIDSTGAGRPTLYDPQTPGRGFLSVAGSVMTLEYDTSGLSASDTILIFWDDGQSTGDAAVALAAALSPANIVATLSRLPASALYPLLVALTASAPDLGEGGSVPALDSPMFDLSGFLVKSR